jgi:hypothetical protein
MVLMRHVARGWPVLIVLAAWILLGPIGMAFDNCAAMMALCDGGPCGVVAAVTLATPVLAPPSTVTSTGSTTPELLPVVIVRPLDPPPKSAPLSA